VQKYWVEAASVSFALADKARTGHCSSAMLDGTVSGGVVPLVPLSEVLERQVARSLQTLHGLAERYAVFFLSLRSLR
jgi:hypothetical protein